jgi:hypothetical protein
MAANRCGAVSLSASVQPLNLASATEASSRKGVACEGLGRKSLKNGQFSLLFGNVTPREDDGRSLFLPQKKNYDLAEFPSKNKSDMERNQTSISPASA